MNLTLDCPSPWGLYRVSEENIPTKGGIIPFDIKRIYKIIKGYRNKVTSCIRKLVIVRGWGGVFFVFDFV